MTRTKLALLTAAALALAGCETPTSGDIDSVPVIYNYTVTEPTGFAPEAGMPNRFYF